MSESDEESSGGVWKTLKDAVRDGFGSNDEDSEEGSDEAAEGEGDEDEKDEFEKAKETVAALEDDPPEDLSEWPSDQAKYETFGGSDSEAYDDGATVNLGPPSLRRYPDGSIEIAGEKVDNPEDYKGKPIKGGPTDPDVNESEVAPPDEKYEDAEGDSDDEGEGSGSSEDDGSGGTGGSSEDETSGDADASDENDDSDKNDDTPGSATGESESGEENDEQSDASSESDGGGDRSETENGSESQADADANGQGSHESEPESPAPEQGEEAKQGD